MCVNCFLIAKISLQATSKKNICTFCCKKIRVLLKWCVSVWTEGSGISVHREKEREREKNREEKEEGSRRKA